MRFMMILKSDAETESGGMPSDDVLNEMGRFNEELIAADAMLAGEGLHPSSEGARVDVVAGERSVTDGPFAEAKELIAGFWILKVDSKEDAIAWAKRVPMRDGRIELRRIQELEDFNQENEYVKKEAEWRDKHGEGRTA